MKKFALRILCDESAVTSIEYALLGSLIAVAIVTGVSTVGKDVAAIYEYVKDRVVLAM